MKLSFADLSDGEKCFMICALVLAANEFYGPLLFEPAYGIVDRLRWTGRQAG